MTSLPTLDGRITDEKGKPVLRLRLVRGWFMIQRAAGAGVELVTQIPGYLSQVTLHDSQDDAATAAEQVYAGYCTAITTLGEQETRS